MSFNRPRLGTSGPAAIFRKSTEPPAGAYLMDPADDLILGGAGGAQTITLPAGKVQPSDSYTIIAAFGTVTLGVSASQVPAASGGIGGNPTVSLAQGQAVEVVWDGATTWQIVSDTSGGFSGINQLTGDVLAGPGTGSVPAQVVKINGASVPAAGALTIGNVLQVTGASADGYAPVNLAGGAAFVSGLLPNTNQQSQSVFTYQPGATGPLPPSVYTSFAALDAAIVAFGPGATIIFDSSQQGYTPIVIPAGTAHWQGCTISSAYQDTISFADGAHIDPNATWFAIQGGTIVSADGTTPVFTPSQPFAIVEMNNVEILGTTSTFLHVTAATSPATLTGASPFNYVGDGTHAAISVDASATLNVNGYNGTLVQTNALTGSGTANVGIDAASVCSATQSITHLNITKQSDQSLLAFTTAGLSLPSSPVTLATSGSTTLTSTQYKNPILAIATVTLVGGAVLIFPNVAGVWFVDISKVTLSGQTLTYKSGTASSAAISTLTSTSQLHMVVTTGSNGISVNV